MSGDTPDPHLSRISTYWAVICQANQGPSEAARAAQQWLLERYNKAIKRYLLGALRNEEAAEECAQEFALRFLKGDCRGANPERGRFRDFVKGVLFHLIADHHRGRQRQPRHLPESSMEPADSSAGPDDADRQFLETWRAELLDRAWKGLAGLQNQTGQPYYTVLRLRAEHAEMRSAQMAELLSQQRDKPVTADWVRQTLRRARDRFAELLVDEVAQTLKAPRREQIEQELSELELLDYCRQALDRVGEP
jgi:RNA polymerase sigma-70 factor (ECF subfamily)